MIWRLLDIYFWLFVKKVDYKKYIRSVRWKRKADKRRRKDKFICQGCGARGYEVHHRTYKRLGHERLSDLETLCPKCHRSRHGL